MGMEESSASGNRLCCGDLWHPMPLRIRWGVWVQGRLEDGSPAMLSAQTLGRLHADSSLWHLRRRFRPGIRGSRRRLFRGAAGVQRGHRAVGGRGEEKACRRAGGHGPARTLFGDCWPVGDFPSVPPSRGAWPSRRWDPLPQTPLPFSGGPSSTDWRRCGHSSLRPWFSRTTKRPTPVTQRWDLLLDWKGSPKKS